MSFPPFVALLVGIALGFSNFSWPLLALDVLKILGATLVPLALIAVGYQLRLAPTVLKKRWKPLSLGLAFKLVFAPALFIALYVFLLGSRSFSTQVRILEAAMAPMITAGVVADEFGFDTELSNLMIGIGIPLSFATVTAWNFILIHLGFSG